MKHLYALLLFVFLCSCKNDLADVRSLDYNNSPITIAKSINSVYTDSGIVSSKLISPKMYNFSNMDFPYFEFPESVEIILFDKDKNESIITADYVISYNNTDLVDLRTNVIIITSSKDTLYANWFLTWCCYYIAVVSDFFLRLMYYYNTGVFGIFYWKIACKRRYI